MNAQQFLLPDGRESGVWFCGKCRIVAHSETQAARCCNWKCEACGAPSRKYYMLCDTCQKVKWAREDQARYDKATKIPEAEYSGWVTDGDRFFESVDELRDYYHGEDLPDHVWACTSNAFVNVGVDDVIAVFQDDAYEDFDSYDLEGLAELKDALSRFVEANAGLVSYQQDYKRCIVLSREKEVE